MLSPGAVTLRSIAPAAALRPANPTKVEHPRANVFSAAIEVNVCTAAHGGARERVSGQALMNALVAIVGERTGYTADMLEPDLDLEADLSIDSIKRIEILSELAEQIGMPGMDEDGADEETIEELVRLKTLSAIVGWIDAHADDAAATAGPSASDAPADSGSETDELEHADKIAAEMENASSSSGDSLKKRYSHHSPDCDTTAWPPVSPASIR